MQIENRNRIPFSTELLMLGFGLLIDTLQLILGIFVIGIFINSVINAIVVPTMWFWFKMRGVEYMSDRKKMTKDLALKAGEFVPLVNFLPLTTISIYISIKSANREDDEYNQNQVQKAKQNAIQNQYAQQSI